MDETTDIGRAPRDVDEERTARAFSAVITGGRPVSTSVPDTALRDVIRRARRQHRRRLAGAAAISAAAVGALVLAGPAALDLSGRLTDRGTSVSSPISPRPVPDGEDLDQREEPPSRGAGVPLLDLPMTDVQSSRPQGRGSDGYCVRGPQVGPAAPTQVWWATVSDPRGAGLPASIQRVEELVMRWGDGPDAGARVSEYAQAMTQAPLMCTGPNGQVQWLPVSPTAPVAGPVAGAVLAPDDSRGTWRYRVSAPSTDGLSVVELTVDVQAADAPAAIAAVDPLLVAALQDASIAELQHSPEDPTSRSGLSTGGSAESGEGLSGAGDQAVLP